MAQDSSTEVESAAEATIFENEMDNNGGGYNRVCVGNLASTGSTRRGYIRYELPDIPAGATVTRVALELVQVRVRKQGAGSPKTATVELRRVSEAWTEGTGSPQQEACGGGTAGAGINWAGPPAHRGQISAVESLPSNNTVVFIMDTDVGSSYDGLLEDVQAWVDDSASNFGWMLRVEEEGTIDNARLIGVRTLTVYWTADGGGGEGIPIDAGLNGNWWSGLDRNGEGAQIEVADGGDGSLVFVATVYSYDTMGNQIFLIAVGTVDGDSVEVDVFITDGGLWGDDFDPGLVNETPWGTGSIKANSCQSILMILKPNAEFQAMGYTDMSYELVRLTTSLIPCPLDDSG